MFKMIKSELKTKSKFELYAMFNKVAGTIPVIENPNLELAKSLLCMIKAELQNREP